MSFYFSEKAAWAMRKNIVPGGIRRLEFGLGSAPTIPHLTFFQVSFIAEPQSYLQSGDKYSFQVCEDHTRK